MAPKDTLIFYPRYNEESCNTKRIIDLLDLVIVDVWVKVKEKPKLLNWFWRPRNGDKQDPGTIEKVDENDLTQIGKYGLKLPIRNVLELWQNFCNSYQSDRQPSKKTRNLSILESMPSLKLAGGQAGWTEQLS